MEFNELLENLELMSFEGYDNLINSILLSKKITAKEEYKLDQLFLKGANAYLREIRSLDAPHHLKDIFGQYTSIYKEYKGAIKQRLMREGGSLTEKHILLDVQDLYHPIISSFKEEIALIDNSNLLKDEMMDAIRMRLKDTRPLKSLRKESKKELNSYRRILNECKNIIKEANIETLEGRTAIAMAINEYEPLFEDYHIRIFGKPLNTSQENPVSDDSGGKCLTVTIYLRSK